MIGTTLGHFQIERKFGAGGMGEVYRARDTKLGRDVALKLLPQTTPEKLARFEREARAVAALAHPNIVVLHAIEQHEGQHYLVLELVEGQDLSESIAPGGLPIARVLELAIPIAEALASAHERGVVHRDLKPANIRLGRDGRIKVLDFGLARMLEEDTEVTRTRLTEAGEVFGTVPYMAPEQLRGDPVDARADLFSFGVLVYELATGRRPFEGRTAMEISSAILRDIPVSLSEVRKDVPRELARIVERCLERDPRERIQNALDVVNELRRISTGKAARPARREGEVSIAVLPFANRSANPEDEYFADGLADELLDVLAQIRGLRVTARTSSAQFKGRSDDVAKIGEKLNVETLLEGSVRKSGNRVRIGVHLVRVADAEAVWSKTYDRALDDIFAVQDDIAQSVVKELRKTLLGEAGDSEASRNAREEVARAAAQGRSSNPEAQRLLLRARHIGMHRNRENLSEALALLERALELDPAFVAAWTEYGRLNYTYVAARFDPSDSRLETSHMAIQKALALDPEFAPAYAQSAWMKLNDLDVRGAREDLRQAQRIDPEHHRVLILTGILATCDGRFQEAMAIQERAMAQDPLAVGPYVNQSDSLAAVGRLEEALEAIRAAVELAPRSYGLQGALSLCLKRLGRIEEALDAAGKELDEGLRRLARALASEVAGERGKADEELHALIEHHAGRYPVLIAVIHAARGQVDLAFSWLDRAGTARDSEMYALRTWPELESLHGDPRWAELLQALGFQP